MYVILKFLFLILVPEIGWAVSVPKRLIMESDTLVIADVMTLNLKVFRSQVFQLKSQEGYSEVSTMIQHGKLKVEGYRFVVLLFRRADLWLPDKQFREGVAECLESIRRVNEHATVVLCTTLPSPRDNRHTIRVAGDQNGYLSLLSAEGPNLQFSKPGKGLFMSGGTITCFLQREWEF